MSLTKIVRPLYWRGYQAWKYRPSQYASSLLNGLEPEARFLPLLCAPDRVSVDVGGNLGGYAWILAQLSRRCHVFEPNPGLYRRLCVAFAFDRRVIVHRIALSDRSGETSLRIPLKSGVPVHGLATVESANSMPGLQTTRVEVKRRRLDDLGLTDIGFIKIDVEGHELAVLKGAEQTLRRYKPALLVEADTRQRPDAVASVVAFLESLGYGGRFLSRGELTDISKFDRAIHQDRGALDEFSRLKAGAIYIANFLFSTSW
jgi:FkbM family methyltransferase